MNRVLVCVLTAALSLGNGQQTVHQPAGDVYAVEGARVTLDCSYDSIQSDDCIFWYKQQVNAAPEFVLSISKIGQGKTEKKYADRFRSSMDASATQAPLHIESVKLSDSALYYCALRPAIRMDAAVGYKIVIRGGTSFTVEHREDFEPSFYKLEAGNLKACLATGFSRHNATEKAGKGHMFEESHAVRISDDSLYNRVALLSAAHNDTCEEGDRGPGRCRDALVPDKKVNLLSVTVLALRLVFAKTLAINCVMTLCLWFGAPE